MVWYDLNCIDHAVAADDVDIDVDVDVDVDGAGAVQIPSM